MLQFIQTLIVGLSGLKGPLVRPNWQPEPPQQPDINTNWIGLGVEQNAADASAYLGLDDAGKVDMLRFETLNVQLQIYGPKCEEVYGEVRDGLQIPQNRIALYQANMNFKEFLVGRHVPDLVNQRWVDRVLCSVVLVRQIQRTYPVLTFLSASGIIYIPDVTEDYQLAWELETPEED